MSSPFFSIIIPTYNAATTLPHTLESVARQSFPDYEVVVVDGLSDDDSVDVIRLHQAADERIRFLSEKDEGIYDAMNKGVQAAKGQWLYFLGSDDTLYTDNVLAEIAQTIDQSGAQKLVYGNVKRYAKNETGYEWIIYGGKFDADKLLRFNICHQAIFYRRSLFSEFGLFNTEYPILADWDFNLRCFNRVNPHYTDTVVANFYTTGKSGVQTDLCFEKEFLRNMFFRYPYTFKHRFFNNQRKNILALAGREVAGLRLTNAARIVKTLLYHVRRHQTRQNISPDVFK